MMGPGKNHFSFGLLCLVLLAGFLLVGKRVAWSQSAPERYWVQFSGKTNEELLPGYSTPYQVDAPVNFLSPKSIARRARQNIVITAHDLPIPPSYIAALDTIREIEIILQSKWFNAVTVRVTDSLFDPQSLMDWPMVSAVKSVQRMPLSHQPTPIAAQRSTTAPDTSWYGKGWEALTQLNADWLHGLGFTGQGMTIAVLDAGFENVESLPIFQKAWDEGRIIEGMDAMQSQGGLFAHHRHGTAVLGTMAGYLPDSLIGTAPMAHYVLYRTEDAYSEFLIEEDYWVTAAEHADSLGVDLMNTSLGYSMFDDSTMNHAYEDLNGVSTRISQAATWAAEKGIVCVTSAGNSGNGAWHYITAPADAKGILTAGAVDVAGNHAPFSGWGPTSDGRIKPDVMALGVQAAYPFADSTIRRGNGTSFSSPILCGAVACLWQAFPEASAAQILAAVVSSSHLSAQPNDSMGHGIPDMRIAFAALDVNGSATWQSSENALLLFPNPATSGVLRWLSKTPLVPDQWRLFGLSGQVKAEGAINDWSTDQGERQGWVDLGKQIPAGHYIFQLLQAGVPVASASWVLAPQ